VLRQLAASFIRFSAVTQGGPLVSRDLRGGLAGQLGYRSAGPLASPSAARELPGSDETILLAPEISRKQIAAIMTPIKQRGSIMATILNAIYRAFLKEFFAENAQDCGRLRGADPSTHRFVLESAFTAHEG
jgi:hypothetical protein